MDSAASAGINASGSLSLFLGSATSCSSLLPLRRFETGPISIRTISSLELLHLFDFAFERSGVAPQAGCILATAGVERSGFGRRTAANFGHGRHRGIHFRIPLWGLHSGLLDHRVFGLDKGREF